MKDTMLEFPVNVSRSSDGEYIAILADVPDGPTGHGVDPYAAFDALNSLAQDILRQFQRENRLPSPSPLEDRPAVAFDSTPEAASPKPQSIESIGGRGDRIEMIGYCWTNHLVFPDN